jgi:hypothetical protein
MTGNNQTAAERKESEIQQIITLYNELNTKPKSKSILKKLSDEDRIYLLEELEAQKQFVKDFIGGELILERIN